MDRMLVSWELDMMAQADVECGHGQFICMLQMNVPVVLLDPGFNGMASMPNVNLTTLAGYAVQAWRLTAQVILHGPKEAGNLPQWEAHRLDVVSRQHLADVIEGHADKGKKGD
jgi:hypothetical protein